MTISCSLAIEGNQLLFPACLPGASRGRDAASVLQPQPCYWAWSITRMPAGPGSSWHAGNLLDFTSSVTRTNASGRTNFSAARLHAFSIVFQHDLLFVTAEFSPRCSTYPCKLPFSGCWRRLNLAQHLSSSRFPKGKQKTPCSGLQLEDEGHGAQSGTASFKKQEGRKSLLHHLTITVAGPKNLPSEGSTQPSTWVLLQMAAWAWWDLNHKNTFLAELAPCKSHYPVAGTGQFTSHIFCSSIWSWTEA